MCGVTTARASGDGATVNTTGGAGEAFGCACAPPVSAALAFVFAICADACMTSLFPWHETQFELVTNLNGAGP